MAHEDARAGIQRVQPERGFAPGIFEGVGGHVGREMNYSWVLKESKPGLAPPVLDLGASLPPVEVAIPGKTELI